MNFDNTIKVGDIVTGYHKGYWRVTSIEDRGSVNPLVTYEKVLDSNRNPCGKTEKQCDMGYCKKMDKSELVKQMSKDSKAFYDGFKRLIDLT